MSVHEESSISSEDAGGDPYGRTSQSNSPTNGHLQCPLCGIHEFTSVASLLDHCQGHPEAAPVASSLNCSVCSLASATKEAFVAHLASHLPQQHQCLVCGFTTKSQAKLNEHLAEVHGVDPAESNTEVTTRAPSGHGKVIEIFFCQKHLVQNKIFKKKYLWAAELYFVLTLNIDPPTPKVHSFNF